MTYPEESVMVGIIKREGDVERLLDERWYRIPCASLVREPRSDYLAFYLSGYPGRKRNTPGIYYYARNRGYELAYRRDLLPDEVDNPRANDVYYKVQLGPIIERKPPITNPGKRVITFIWTTYDRFVHARVVNDLYSKNDYFVDRIYHALQDRSIEPIRYWDVDKATGGRGAGVRVLCERGTVDLVDSDAQNGRSDEMTVLYDAEAEFAPLLQRILAQVDAMGGPVMIPVGR